MPTMAADIAPDEGRGGWACPRNNRRHMLLVMFADRGPHKAPLDPANGCTRPVTDKRVSALDRRYEGMAVNTENAAAAIREWLREDPGGICVRGIVRPAFFRDVLGARTNVEDANPTEVSIR
jgi:hypothetical protein